MLWWRDSGGLGGRRRRRERKYIVWLLLVLVVLACICYPVVTGAPSRLGRWWTWGSDAATTVGEAFSVVEVLGEHPNDDKLIDAIKDRDMRGRKLAIEFLGEGGYGDALPVFERIIRDTTEDDAMRVAALEGTLFIARWKARELAKEYRHDAVLGKSARTILNKESEILNRPSRVRALLGVVK